MAWISSGDTNEELVNNMQKRGLIRSDVVAEAMKRVDRANYVRLKGYAYDDAPQTIGHGATISAPHMHAHASEYLLPWIHPDAHILDVGSGSGYTVAVFHHLIKTTSSARTKGTVTPSAISPGKVVGIEHIRALVDWSVGNLKSDGLGGALDKGEIVMVTGDGRKGWAAGAPYDVIHVGAAAPEIPQALIDMLKAPGRMFIPVGPDGGDQDIWTVDKDAEGNVKKTRLFGVRYVPLTDEATQTGSRY
ncbi:Protein-L-isoaspartate O-methyltransferase {ECO:0000256/RuleBase:RU003802} {ECO:0000256/RuleBase:RU003802} [Serendipita indica DSM 11827]|uniref:Protein-L-isoaspartate O-methyltransferase n=1 Tax=Serendipita indica (strain DSM 11827) TaxID=1109443 RepID=G4TUU5_SERID|nr:Protein-L-isoaspartate O-methyltransferase {ECO:0000256/RuleBase:RU003802} {ECO:0000256/RuleBase:RU003802} [Serendipita indica DSM 11827]CCA75088.1 related to protein-L-isoaspartate(D-aspartate) O-methyltransferase [Serendipita indica DSM 11827]